MQSTAERIKNCGWKSYSVYPTKTITDRELGKRVAGYQGIFVTRIKTAPSPRRCGKHAKMVLKRP